MARQSAEKIAELQDLVRRKREELDEDSFRYFLGEQALKLGHGGQTLMVRLSGASVSTVRKGMSEVRARILGEEPEPPKKKSPSPKGYSRTAKSSRGTPVPGAEICLVGCERALADSGEPGEEPPEVRREFPDAIRRSGRGFDIADVVGVAPYGDWNYLVRGFIKITFINE
ncbi:MAG: hypothetical protein VZR11_09765 [Succinimonas sp.]|nr:hypothetical protein [Succinimonas sp.]